MGVWGLLCMSAKYNRLDVLDIRKIQIFSSLHKGARSAVCCGAQASHSGGFSCCRAWAPGRMGFNSCSTQAQQLWLPGSTSRAHVLAQNTGICNLPRSGIEHMSPVLASRFLSTALSGKLHKGFFH